MTARRGDDEVTDLAIAAARGDDRALEQFIRHTRDDVWRLVGYLGDRRNADDLTQETYLRAIRALPRFSGRAPARVWLISIARRVVVDQVRHEMSRPRMDLYETADTIATIAPRTERHDGRVEVQMLIDALDPDRREALVLTQILGVSYADAAAVCGCPVGTIRSRVARARDDLQAAMRADGRRSG
ncbi:sigma-70 family RNA polymerase sigma factor [Gordonia sp. NPDC003424]